MNTHRLPDIPSNHYLHVVEESYRPLPPVKAKPTPQPPERFVETLRNRGIKLRVQHYRYTALDPAIRPAGELVVSLARICKHERKGRAFPDVIFQNGGETRVTVTLQDGREAEGVAVCSTADQYRKKVGVYVAAKRALAALKPDRSVPTIGCPVASVHGNL